MSRKHDAEEHFAKSSTILMRSGARWYEAENLLLCSRGLRHSGEPRLANEKLDEALERFAGFGVGRGFLDRLGAERE